MLNGIIHNRHGAWGVSSWNYGRNAENRLLRYLRRNSLLSVVGDCHEYGTFALPAYTSETAPTLEVGIETITGEWAEDAAVESYSPGMGGTEITYSPSTYTPPAGSIAAGSATTTEVEVMSATGIRTRNTTGIGGVLDYVGADAEILTTYNTDDRAVNTATSVASSVRTESDGITIDIGS